MWIATLTCVPRAAAAKSEPVLRYHLAPADIKAGDTLLSGEGAPVVPGSVLPLRLIPPGTPIHNVELFPGKGGQLARSANTAAVLQVKQKTDAIVKLPSGASPLLHEQAQSCGCVATVTLPDV